MALDFGETAIAITYASIAFWTGVLLIRKKRPEFLLRTDHIYMKVGLLVLSLLSYPASLLIWSLRSKW